MSATTISFAPGTTIFDGYITSPDFASAITQELGPDPSIFLNDSQDLVGYQLAGAEVWAPLRSVWDVPVITSDAGYVTAVPPRVPVEVTPEPRGLVIALFAALALTVLVKGVREVINGRS